MHDDQTPRLEAFAANYWLSCSAVRAYIRGDSEWFRKQAIATISAKDAALASMFNLRAMGTCGLGGIATRANAAVSALSIAAFCAATPAVFESPALA